VRSRDYDLSVGRALIASALNTAGYAMSRTVRILNHDFFHRLHRSCAIRVLIEEPVVGEFCSVLLAVYDNADAGYAIGREPEHANGLAFFKHVAIEDRPGDSNFLCREGIQATRCSVCEDVASTALLGWKDPQRYVAWAEI
jgi:hypothetical protein